MVHSYGDIKTGLSVVGHVENRVEYQRSKYSLRFILFLDTAFKALPSEARKCETGPPK